MTERNYEEAEVFDLTKYAKVLNWIPPEHVPNCLSSRLKTISIKGLTGKAHIGYLDEMELTKYLLKHGRVLEKMNILLVYIGVQQMKSARKFQCVNGARRLLTLN